MGVGSPDAVPLPRAKQSYLKIRHQDLIASEGWKKLSPLQQGEALRMLLMHAIEGKLPERWSRMAELRVPGSPPGRKKTRKPPNRYAAFTAAWEKAWEENRGEKWVWDGKQRGGLRLAYEKAGGDILLFESRVRLLLFHKNPWHTERASPAHLNSYWNELAGGPKTARVQPPPVPAGCYVCKKTGVSVMRTQDGDICMPCWKMG